MTEGAPVRNDRDKTQLGWLGWALLVGGLLCVVAGLLTSNALIGIGVIAAAVGAIVVVATGGLRPSRR